MTAWVTLARAARVLALTLACAAAALATHGGEFWPFSTFSMFASAGRPWQRAVVRSVDEPHGWSLRSSYALDALPGRPLPLDDLGVTQDDLSSLVRKAEGWSGVERAALVQMFGALSCRSPVVICRVRGALHDGEVEQVATPVARLTCEGGSPRVQPLLGELP